MANFIYASLSNANKNPIGIHPNEMTCSVLFVQKKGRCAAHCHVYTQCIQSIGSMYIASPTREIYVVLEKGKKKKRKEFNKKEPAGRGSSAPFPASCQKAI